MNAITDAQVTAYVEANIGAFHSKRLEALKKLRRKNPYLFKSKNLTVASDLIRSLLTAHLSSQEETLFGEFLEGLAIYVAEIVHGGQKSAATGIDLEFTAERMFVISSPSSPVPTGATVHRSRKCETTLLLPLDLFAKEIVPLTSSL